MGIYFDKECGAEMWDFKKFDFWYSSNIYNSQSGSIDRENKL